MKPVRLEAEGFTCYRERQQPLEFSGLSLFAIAGPTGAGKSSILDTMLYALYGEVPRIGKQGVGEFISHGRDAMSVSLDFAVRGAVYRVTRRVKRGKKNNLTTVAVLAELLPAGERSVAEGVKPVNEAIARLLGLDFNAFTQTVILPQGEFAKFLKAAPTDQRAILQHLLRHEVFERMRAEAERRRLEADRDVLGLDRQLSTLEHATPEALDSSRAELAALTAAHAELAERKARQEAALQEQRIRHQLTGEVRGLRSRLAAFDAAAPSIAAKRDELTASRRAAHILPRIEACAAAATRVAEAERERHAASVAVAASAETVRAAESDVEGAMAGAEAAAGLAQTIRALDEIKAALTRRQALRADLATYERTLPASRKRAAAAATADTSAREQHRAAESALAAARASLDASGFDATEQHRLDDLWTTVAQVRAGDDELSRLADGRQRLDVALQRAKRAASAEAKAFARASEAAAAAAAAERAATTALEQGQMRFQAASVRSHLHAGDPCPVCLQTVVLLPPQEPVPELQTLTLARTEARAVSDASQQALQAAAAKRAAADADAASARQALDAASATVEQKTAERQVLRARIIAALAGQAPIADDVDVCAVVEARRSALRVAKDAHDRAAGAVRAAEAAAAGATLALARAEHELMAAVGERDRLERESLEKRSELDALQSQIAAVTTSDDPAAERAALAQRLSRIDAALRSAQDVLSRAQAGAAAAAARHAAASSASAQATADAAAAEAALAAALQESAFPDSASATAAVRSAAQQASLDATVQQHDSGRAAVMTRLLEIEPRVANREVSDAEMNVAEAECRSTGDAWHQAGLRVSALEAACERLAREVAARAALQEQAAAVRTRLALTSAMATDLRGDGFQEYLLEEAFHSLVAGASVRMRQMSNRYTLEWSEGDFFVVDHDNAAERRRAETLSGGETFMASLCLALQLSEEVLKTSGALQMDSLFIDEGFGTLDAESLAEVTDAMEALREDGGRLIGVISHRPELTDRLPGCIRVVKGAGESTWRLERQG